MASAQSRSDARGRPPPKRFVFTCTGSSWCNTAHNSSEMRNPVVVRLFGVRSRSRFLVACLFIPPMLSRYQVIRIGTKPRPNFTTCNRCRCERWYRNPIVQSINDLRLPGDAYTSKWSVLLKVTDEYGRRLLGTTEIIYHNPRSYFAEPSITIIGPAL